MSYAGVRSNKEVVDPQDALQIERTATGYRLSYDEGIAGYQLYSVHGYLLERATTDGQTQVDIEMPETEVVLIDLQSVSYTHLSSRIVSTLLGVAMVSLIVVG